jgi:transposase
VIGGEVAGQTAALLYSLVGTCKHLLIDPFAYLREALPALFALGDKPTAERLLDWLPDRWRLNRPRSQPLGTRPPSKPRHSNAPRNH